MIFSLMPKGPLIGQFWETLKADFSAGPYHSWRHFSGQGTLLRFHFGSVLVTFPSRSFGLIRRESTNKIKMLGVLLSLGCGGI